MAGVRRGAFTCVGWHVTLCDSIWQVTSRSSEMGFPWRAISAFTCFYCVRVSQWQSTVTTGKPTISNFTFTSQVNGNRITFTMHLYLSQLTWLLMKKTHRQGKMYTNCFLFRSHHLISACHKRRNIRSYTGLPPVMDFIRRRRLSVFGRIGRLTQGTPAHSVLHCQVGLASGTGDVVLAVLAHAGLTNSATTLDMFLPTSGGRPSYGAMVERRDGPSWLRDDDDDDLGND